MPKIATSVHRVHFEDFDGSEFERLVFAYHCRVEEWQSLEWYGQTGSDLGRDIWGVRTDGKSVCIQCVNRKALTFAKVVSDIDKVLKAPHGAPHRFRVVAQSDISAKMRDRIKAHVKSQGVKGCDIWSGAEFEEFLRRYGEILLKRFVDGMTFPDAPDDLFTLATSTSAATDDAILAMYAKLFDRPAFYTPIHMESNLGDFKQAITDTIQALGTGIWKTRDGHVIDRMPSRHQLKSDSLRTKIQAVEKSLSRLRAEYDDMIRSGILNHCQCNDPKCTVYFFHSPHGAQDLERLRNEVLITFHQAYPSFTRPSW